MTKSEVINELKKVSLSHCIAEVICDIERDNGQKYPNKSIIVYLAPNGELANDDLVKPYLHWTICKSINEFKEFVKTNNMPKNYKMWVVSEFKEVKPFKTDFNNN